MIAADCSHLTLMISVIAGYFIRRKARLLIRAQLQAEYARFSGALLVAGRALELHWERAKEQLRQDEAKAVARHERDKRAACEQYDAGMAKADKRRDEVLQSIQADRDIQHAKNEQRRAAALRQAEEELAQLTRKYQEQHDQAVAAGATSATENAATSTKPPASPTALTMAPAFAALTTQTSLPSCRACILRRPCPASADAGTQR